MEETKYLIAISCTNKIGPKNFYQLKKKFSRAEDIWFAPAEELKKSGLSEKIIQEFIIRRKNIDPNQEIEKLRRENISTITLASASYPKLLKEIYYPPYLLYYKGQITNIKNRLIAVVGTRKISTYGKLATSKITEELLDQNFTIVSGLALGVDSLAHIIAVKNKKTTIAVLGSGLDQQNIYPTANRTLAQEIIINNGILLSEYPIGTLPLKHHFPARNRIISGLSLGTLVIEAGEQSGALITAQFALEQNREVFAVPGPINQESSHGTNSLIKKGAKLVTSIEDILEEFNLQTIKKNNIISQDPRIPDNPEEATILKYLSEPRHINDLVQLTNLPVTNINSALMMLEMKQQVQNLGNMTYIAK